MGAWEGYLTLKVVEGRKIKMLGDKVVDPYVVLSVGAVPFPSPPQSLSIHSH
jgi:hypothetical protein